MVPSPIPPPQPRRVSYVLPPPTGPVPTLSLPPVGISRKGKPGPFYSQSSPRSNANPFQSFNGTRSAPLDDVGAHPRHRLAVQALALDLSTAVCPSGATKDGDERAPEGILYTGGKDGLVCGWELGLPTKRRRRAYGRPHAGAGRAGSDSESSGSDGEEGEGYRRESVDQLDLEGLGPRTVSNGSRRRLTRNAGSKGRRDSSTGTARDTRATYQLDPLPVEQRWQVDDDRIKASAAPQAKFRQCVQSHTDWVNDIVLCDFNRAVVSASSDALILAWNPHSTSHEDQVAPKRIGRHGDYARCLASANEAGWVVSGGFDKQIKIWDIVEGRSNAVVDLSSPPASIYSLSATPSGSLVAAGTPERVIRIWDPRTRRQVARLGGHTDNVRGVLLGDDGKWILSASSDTTVKLWSLAAQKCLHTFSHHSTSVWSLFSQHANLEIFYSGDRSGNICKIDIEGTGDPGEGECVLLARDDGGDDGMGGNEGITQLVAQDDSYVWTAGGSSSVKRWRDIPRRSRRAGPISLRPSHDSIIDTVLLETDSTDSLLSGSHVDSSTLYSADDRASIDGPRSALPSVSFLEGLTSGLSRTTSTPSPRAINFSAVQATNGRPSSLRARPSATLFNSTRTGRLSSFEGASRGSSGNSTPGLASTIPTTLYEIPYESLVPLTSPDDSYFLSSRARADSEVPHHYPGSVNSVPLAYAVAPPRPSTLSTSPPTFRRPQSVAENAQEAETQATHIAQREYFEREAANEATPLRASPDDTIKGGTGLTRCEILSDRRHAVSVDTLGRVALWDIVEARCLGTFAPEDLTLDSRRPSHASSTDSEGGTSMGDSCDILEMVRERIEGEISIATWCKCDTRVGALTIHLEEPRLFDAEIYVDEAHLEALPSQMDTRLVLGKWVLRHLFAGFINAEVKVRARDAEAASPSPPSNHPTFISLSELDRSPPLPSSSMPRTPGMTIALATPALSRAVLPDLPNIVTDLPRNGLFESAPSTDRSLSSMPESPTGTVGTRTPIARTGGDYFSLPPSVTSTPDLALSPSIAPKSPEVVGSPTPGGTLMGRLRLLGKGSKRPTTGDPDAALPAVTATVTAPEIIRTIEEQQQHQILTAVFSKPITPCPLSEAPLLHYQTSMAIIISEETADASAWTVTYRGLVGTTREDMKVLEDKAPLWLLECLLGNRLPLRDPVKVSFIIQPWMDVVRAGLPEIPDSNSRLTANRNLRISKVINYIADKLNLRHSTSRAPSIAGSQDDNGPHPPPDAGFNAMPNFELDRLELLCGGISLVPSMTLATVRALYWKLGGDVVLTYRYSHAR